MEITTIRLFSIRRLIITNSYSSSARIVTNTNGLMSPLNPPSSSRTLHSTTQSNCVEFLIEKIVLVAVVSCKPRRDFDHMLLLLFWLGVMDE